MLERQHSAGGGFFYGWWIVVISMLGISTGAAPFVFASMGLFMLPLQQEFGWNRAQISAVLPLMVIAFMISMPLAGRLIDRLGTRRVLLPSTVAFGLGLAAIPLLVSQLWHLAVVFVFIGIFGVAANTMPYLRTISTWFNRRRGLAIGLAVSGIGLGYAYVPILVQNVIDAGGWRTAYYTLSAIVLCITVPLVALFFRETPAAMGLRPDGGNAAGAPVSEQSSTLVGIPSSAALRRREFWLLSAIFVCIAFVLHGILPHLVPLLRDRGVGAETAAAVASAMGATVFVSRIFIGYLIDCFFAPRVAMIFFSLSAIGFFMLSATSYLPLMFIAAVLIGLSLGAEVDLLAYLCGKYFGLRSFAEIYGLLFIGVMAGSAFGPYAFGYGFESTGSYSGVLVVSVLLNAFALGVAAMLGPYPAESTGKTRQHGASVAPDPAPTAPGMPGAESSTSKLPG